MFTEKKSNEYGEYYYREVPGNEKVNRAIVFIHDYILTPELHDDFCDKLKFFNYYGIIVPYDRIKDYDQEVGLEKVVFVSLIKKIKDLILSFPEKEIYLIGNGIGGTLALALASLLSSRIKKLVLVNPYTSMASANTIKTITTLPLNLDEAYDLVVKMFGETSPLLINKNQSPIVVSAMRKIYYNINDYINFVNDLILPKTLEAIKVYEHNSLIPTLLIVGDANNFIPAVESIVAYKKNKNVKVLQLPNSWHCPINDDNKQTYIDSILKFFIDGIGLNSADRLPSKEIYKYLSDEWKKYYRTTFGEKLSEREQKEYMEKLAEYEKETKSEIQTFNDMDNETANQFISQQSVYLKQMQDQASYNWHLNEYNKKTKEFMLTPDVYIDYTIPANKIVVNNQGFEVYHDGKGNGFYRDYDGKWKKIVDKTL